jgi:surface protein
MRARRTHAPAYCVRAVRVCGCNWAPKDPRRHVRAPSAGVDRVWLGSQAFLSNDAFNANIGAWNTARVTSMQEVCAGISARAVRHRRLCAAATADARSRVCAAVWARACAGIHVCRYSCA